MSFSRTPFRLIWWLTKDLLRLVALSAGVLVSVIAMAATVKPVSDGLLQAENFLIFVVYAVPPMLAFALPFATGFGSTIVYHKFAVENESTAAYAGGVSHRAVLVPALMVGLLMACVLAVLNEVAIPGLLQRMQRLVTRDLSTWLVQEIDKGKSVDIGGFSMLAQSAKRAQPAAGSEASDVLYLTKVAAMERDAQGNPSTEVTAERAWIMLYPASEGSDASDSGRSRVMMRLENVIGSRAGQGGGGARKSLDLGWMLGTGFRDNVKFLSWQGLREIKDVPERLNWVDAPRRDVAYLLGEERATRVMRAAVTKDSRFTLLDEDGGRVEVYAGSMLPSTRTARAWELLPKPGEAVLKVVQVRGERGARVEIEGATARLVADVGRDRFDRALTFHIELENVKVTDYLGTEGTARSSERATYRLVDLRAMPDPLASLLASGSHQLLEQSAGVLRRETGDLGASGLAAARDTLEKVMQRAIRQAMAKQHERLALATSCVVMAMLGGVLALRLSRRLPVVVYMMTFAPAVLCLVLLSSGQQVTVAYGGIGLYVTWSGVVVLAIYTALQYRLLVRH